MFPLSVPSVPLVPVLFFPSERNVVVIHEIFFFRDSVMEILFEQDNEEKSVASLMLDALVKVEKSYVLYVQACLMFMSFHLLCPHPPPLLSIYNVYICMPWVGALLNFPFCLVSVGLSSYPDILPQTFSVCGRRNTATQFLSPCSTATELGGLFDLAWLLWRHSTVAISM